MVFLALVLNDRHRSVHVAGNVRQAYRELFREIEFEATNAPDQVSTERTSDQVEERRTPALIIVRFTAARAQAICPEVPVRQVADAGRLWPFFGQFAV
jgi:hypothetical protein